MALAFDRTRLLQALEQLGADLSARGLFVELAVYGGGALRPDAWLEGIEEAAAAGPQRVLVSVFLDGGADSLSMLFPAEDPLYRRLRPRLALPPDHLGPERPQENHTVDHAQEGEGEERGENVGTAKFGRAEQGERRNEGLIDDEPSQHERWGHPREQRQR